MARVKLFMLGTFSLTVNGQFRDGFRSAKVRALLAYLALEGRRPLLRTRLMDALWDGYNQRSALASLRVGLANLRGMLDPLQMVKATRQAVQFNTHHPDFGCDVLALDALAKGEIDAAGLAELNELRHANQLELLPGFEHLDSVHFRAWLEDRRAYYQPNLAQLKQAPAQRLPAAIAPAEPPLPAGRVTGAHPWPASDGVGAVPEMGLFVGRQPELDQLKAWIVDQPGAPRARLVALLGMGGQGKSALAAHFIRSLIPLPQPSPPVASPLGAEAPIPQPAAGLGQGRFAHILWTSLLNAPPLAEVLQRWIQTLSTQQVSELPPSLDQQLDLLHTYLRSQRCLLVLDNVESIMATGERAGHYRPGYEGYGQLLQRVGEWEHQSCLLLTSREEPYALKRLAIGSPVIQLLRLGGLTVQAGQTMLHGFGLTGGAAAGAEVVRRYSGNPLALKLVAAVIQELFHGDAQVFLAEEVLVFDDIRDVLDQHFARLSTIESDLLYWLAIEREPVSFPALCANLVHSPRHPQLLEAVRSLQRRSLVESYGERLGLQNVIIEYTTGRLVERICQELADVGLGISLSKIQNSQSNISNSHLNRFALVKAQAREYVRESQVRLLLQPVAEWLMAHLGEAAIALRFQGLLRRL